MTATVIPLETHISDLQKQRDNLDWSGDFDTADFLQRLISSAIEEREKGEIYHPLF
tara:strand:+ start:2435 stop:2602 length:168 start_codon:yes stop_codon:yes gene_type:complete